MCLKLHFSFLYRFNYMYSAGQKNGHFDFTDLNSANSLKSFIIVIAMQNSIIPESFSEIGEHLCLLHGKTACRFTVRFKKNSTRFFTKFKCIPRGCVSSYASIDMQLTFDCIKQAVIHKNRWSLVVSGSDERKVTP